MRAPRSIGQFADDDRGTILVLVAVFLGLFLGFVALSFDLGRLSVTNSDLQSYADTVALAAAAELDGEADAITRATAAAAELVSDRQTFGTGDRTLSGTTDYTLTFLASLPNSDTVAATDTTTDPAAAVLVRVDVTPVTVNQGFAGAFRALMGMQHVDPNTTASATAGFTQMACDTTPLMFCIPSSTWSADDPGVIGSMINLRSGGQGAAWGPGDFGFIAPNSALIDPAGPCAGKSGAPLYRCLVGATGSITGCVAQRGVDMEPGQKVGLAEPAFNTRFDIYTGAMQSSRNDPAYAAAPNVLKGLVRSATTFNAAQQCLQNTAETSPHTVALPKDDCIAAGTCRVGDGTYDWTNYLTKNYGGAANDPRTLMTGPYPDVEPGSRYEMYLREIELAYGTDPFSVGGASTSTPIIDTPHTDGTVWEGGLPVCSTVPPTTSARRLIIAAGIDCAANAIKGAATGVPVHEFVLMFLTEPVSNYGATTPPTVDIFAEIVGRVDGDGAGSGGMGGVFRDLVQLYR